MARSISDIIEQFIIENIADQEYINISRNQLAELFNCVPSQINYVLSTRFTLDKGYIIESRRGGGGYISILRIPADKKKYLSTLINYNFSDSLTLTQAEQILNRLEYEEIITEKERKVISAAISDKSLMVADNIKGYLRANIFKNIINELLKYA